MAQIMRIRPEAKRVIWIGSFLLAFLLLLLQLIPGLPWQSSQPASQGASLATSLAPSNVKPSQTVSVGGSLTQEEHAALQKAIFIKAQVTKQKSLAVALTQDHAEECRGQPEQPPTKTGKPPGVCNSYRRNLIIGAAMNYDFRELLPFMHSFVKSGTSQYADVLFIVNPNPSPKLREGCKRYGCFLFVQGEDWTMDDVLTSRGFSKDHKIKGHSACFRYLLYEAVVNKFEACYDKVIIADTRDLFFQRNPFQYVRDGLYVSQEQINIADPECCEFGEDGFYGKWNRERVDCAVKGASEKIIAKKGRHTPVICSGVTLGTTKAIRGYLAAMVKFYKEQDKVHYCHGVDQGVHMYLLSTPGLIPGKITYLSNEVGPVFNNVCYQPQKKKPTMVTQAHQDDAPMKLRNGNRSMIAAIVHQYDRCGYLHSMVKYGLKDVDDQKLQEIKDDAKCT